MIQKNVQYPQLTSYKKHNIMPTFDIHFVDFCNIDFEYDIVYGTTYIYSPVTINYLLPFVCPTTIL